MADDIQISTEAIQRINDSVTILEQNMTALKSSVADITDEATELDLSVPRIQAKVIILEAQHLIRLLSEPEVQK